MALNNVGSEKAIEKSTRGLQRQGDQATPAAKLFTSTAVSVE
jgi:hypothetical protein